LKLEAETCRPELESAKTDFDLARAKEEAGLAGVRELERTLAALERKHAELGERHKKRIDLRAGGLAEAEARLHAGRADIGRMALQTHGEFSIDSDTVRALREADAQVYALVVDSELHLRALDASDSEKARSGEAWLGTLLLVVLVYAAYRVLL
jgi:hypothetical protein